jgi:hypothetical protein
MQRLRVASKGNVEFIGAGGAAMAAEGLRDSFWDADAYDGKAFVPFRSTNPTPANWWLWLKYNPITYKYNKPMSAWLKEVKANDVVARIAAHRPASVVTIDHEIFGLKV